MVFLDYIDSGSAGGSIPIPYTRVRSDFKLVVYTELFLRNASIILFAVVAKANKNELRPT